MRLKTNFKRIVVTVLSATMLLGTAMLTGCKHYTEEDITQSNQSNDVIENTDAEKFLPLTEIQKSEDEVMELAYNGKWNNLQFEKLNPNIAEGYSDMYNMKETDHFYKNLAGPELMKEQLKLIERYAEDYPKGTFLMSLDKKGYELSELSYEEVMDILEREDMAYQENGTYDISYDSVRKHELYPQSYVTATAFGVYAVDNNKICHTALKQMIERGEYGGGGVPGVNEWFLETVKVYYADATDGSLNDKWNLLDGEMSVQECIDYIENNLRSELPEGGSELIEPNVYLVRVLQVTDDVYAFSCMVNRKMRGLTTEAFPASFANSPEGIDTDMGLVEMIEHNKIDTMYSINIPSVELELGEPIEKILSLEAAINRLSGWIGKNSSYTIHTIDLGCYIRESDGLVTPVWRFIATNNNDKQDYLFEIDCVTERMISRKKKVH